jgi:hypothetical protein
MSSQSFKSLQPYEPRLVALSYAAALLPCVDCTDCSDTSETDATDLTDEMII